ncbi:MAG: hypothetical protein K2M61_05940, partial [Muribaculaceae bacterium]|nr:hypothetical protein [Muribaculaceae bacterium]
KPLKYLNLLIYIALTKISAPVLTYTPKFLRPRPDGFTVQWSDAAPQCQARRMAPTTTGFTVIN